MQNNAISLRPPSFAEENCHSRLSHLGIGMTGSRNGLQLPTKLRSQSGGFGTGRIEVVLPPLKARRALIFGKIGLSNLRVIRISIFLAEQQNEMPGET